MACTLCGARKAKRQCPALGQTICPACCGRKRLVEIQCPPDCGYLVSAKHHPPATVQRRRDKDLRFLWPLVAGLSERQSRLFVFVQAAIGQSLRGGTPLADADVADATGALAATFETADRGIIYEHSPTSLPAQVLLRALKASFEELVSKATSADRRQFAVVLRRVEQGARAAETQLGDGPRAFMELLGRIAAEAPAAAETAPAAGAETGPARLVLP